MKRLLVGRRPVLEALRASPQSVAVVYLDPADKAAARELAEAARRADVRLEERSPTELDALATGLRHQGVVAITGEFSYLDLDSLLRRLPAERPLVVALDEVTDPHNFGAIVRSAVAFGADGLLTLKHRAAPVTPVVVRASAGATEHAAIARVANLAQSLDLLAERGMDIVGLDMDGDVAIDALDVGPGGLVLVVGSEGRGLRRLTRERCTRIASIAMAGPIASLNASVAAGIAIHHASLARARA
jgi:23S rRNA (guanosine2251-2'-O)-methyltransferase